jgi:hypothetical protein
MVSDLVPHLGALVDDICFVHSMQGKTNTHGPGENYMSTGFTLDGFPSMGAWATYALGSEDQSLPAYVAIPDPRGKPQNSVNNWAPGFLPAAFQGTEFNATNPIRNLARPASIPSSRDVATRGFLQRLNEHHAERFPGDTELAARIASYELAARMQLTVPVRPKHGQYDHVRQRQTHIPVLRAFAKRRRGIVGDPFQAVDARGTFVDPNRQRALRQDRFDAGGQDDPAGVHPLRRHALPQRLQWHARRLPLGRSGDRFRVDDLDLSGHGQNRG